jgi:putative membrane protein
MNLIYRLLLNALGLLLISEFVTGIQIDGFYAAVIAAIVLGVLNTIVRPVLFILTLPITILTLGLFTFVLNAAIFLFAASFLEGFEVASFWFALLGSVLMSLVSTVVSRFVASASKPQHSRVTYKEVKEGE